MGLVDGLRSLLHQLQRLRLPDQLELGMGSRLLVRVRALLLLRGAIRLPAALSVVLPRAPILLVLGRVAPLELGVGGPTGPLQVRPARGICAALQVPGA